MPAMAEVISKNTTSSNAHTVNIPGLACRFDAHIAEIEQLWVHTSWKVWDDFMDGREASVG